MNFPAVSPSPNPWLNLASPFLQNQLSIHTRIAYENDLQQFFTWLSTIPSPPQNLAHITTELIIFYRNYLSQSNAKATVNRKVSTIKAFFQFLTDSHYLAHNPAEVVKLFPGQESSPTLGLTDEEVTKILASPNTQTPAGRLHYAILSTLFHLGLRQGELRSLTLESLSQDRGTPTLTIHGKGHKTRTLPIPPQTLMAIHNYLACDRAHAQGAEPLFTPTRNHITNIFNEPLTPNAIGYIVKSHAKRVGITTNISPHSCRATCVSNALDNGASTRQVTVMAGWASANMVERYDKRRDAIINSAVRVVDYGVKK